jgi:hypothetical protein
VLKLVALIYIIKMKMMYVNLVMLIVKLVLEVMMLIVTLA